MLELKQLRLNRFKFEEEHWSQVIFMLKLFLGLLLLEHKVERNLNYFEFFNLTVV